VIQLATQLRNDQLLEH